MAQFACEDVNCAVAIGRETMPQTIDDERIRTVSVSWPVHPALDEIIQELEDKLELKPDPAEPDAVEAVKKESCGDKDSELKGIQVPKPIKDINRELKWSFKSGFKLVKPRSELSRALEKTRRRRIEVQRQLDDANLELKMVLRALNGGHLVQV